MVFGLFGLDTVHVYDFEKLKFPPVIFSNFDNLKLTQVMFMTLNDINNVAPSQRPFPRTKYVWTFPNSSAMLDSIAVSVFVVILVEFDKYCVLRSNE